METSLIQVKINCSTSGEETVIELSGESSCTALLQFHNISEKEMKVKNYIYVTKIENGTMQCKYAYPIIKGFISFCIKRIGFERPVSSPHGNKNHL